MNKNRRQLIVRWVKNNLRIILLLDLKSTDRLAGYALFTSIFAIFFNIYQYKQQSNENKKQFTEQLNLNSITMRNSIRPYISIYRLRFDKEDMGITIANVGLGPALIFDVEYQYQGENCNVNSQCFNDLLSSNKILKRQGYPYYFWSITGEIPMQAGSNSQWLFKFPINDIQYTWASIDFLGRLNVKISYRSLANDTFTAYFNKRLWNIQVSE